MQTTKCLVLGVKRYSFVDEKTGEVKKGSKVRYLEELSAGFNIDSQSGIQPLEVPAPYEAFETFSPHVPAFFELEFRQVPDSKGKPTLQLRNAKHLFGVEFKELLPKAN